MTLDKTWLDNLTYSAGYARNRAQKFDDFSMPINRMYTGKYAWELMKLLNAPYKSLPAYKHGFIDKKGNLTHKKPSTSQEKKDFNYFTKTVLTLRKKLEKIIPDNRLLLTLQKLFLVREDINKEDEEVADLVNKLHELIVSGDISILGSPMVDDEDADIDDYVKVKEATDDIEKRERQREQENSIKEKIKIFK